MARTALFESWYNGNLLGTRSPLVRSWNVNLEIGDDSGQITERHNCLPKGSELKYGPVGQHRGSCFLKSVTKFVTTLEFEAESWIGEYELVILYSGDFSHFMLIRAVSG